MGQIKFLGSILMMILFSFAIIGFAMHFASDNDVSVSIADDSEMSSLYQTSKTSASDFKGESEDTYESIIGSSIGEGDTTTKGVQFSLTTRGLVGSLGNILDVLYNKIFGGGENFGIFLTVFIGFMGTIGILFIWKTWRGNPD